MAGTICFPTSGVIRIARHFQHGRRLQAVRSFNILSLHAAFPAPTPALTRVCNGEEPPPLLRLFRCHARRLPVCVSATELICTVTSPPQRLSSRVSAADTRRPRSCAAIAPAPPPIMRRSRSPYVLITSHRFSAARFYFLAPLLRCSIRLPPAGVPATRTHLEATSVARLLQPPRRLPAFPNSALHRGKLSTFGLNNFHRCLASATSVFASPLPPLGLLSLSATPANNNIVSDSDSNYYDELYPPDTTRWSDHQRIDIPGFRLRIPPVPAGLPPEQEWNYDTGLLRRTRRDKGRRSENGGGALAGFGARPSGRTEREEEGSLAESKFGGEAEAREERFASFLPDGAQPSRAPSSRNRPPDGFFAAFFFLTDPAAQHSTASVHQPSSDRPPEDFSTAHFFLTVEPTIPSHLKGMPKKFQKDHI
ncbi:hypothetical protein KSP39_PZI021323 [Platanthera zijinensis]|uniref:Uncharacterized protein n=1 Tax=Platanthera zijinensis TaxID=2320716 RepID=A0AAP0FVS8_9ASPA